jgi:LacI family transcriptional regulator
MKVSIKDIALKLKVSPAVVSLVLNGKEKEGRINKNTASKIKALASELNYSPNRFAQGLKKGKSNIIGLIIADISNPFYAKLARYIEDEAEKHQYKIIIGSSDENAKKMASLIEVMNTYQVDGFIIVPAENSQIQIEKLIKNKQPLVLVDRYFEGMQVNNVLVNNYETAYNATNYLIEKGCKNIGAFTYQSGLLHFTDRLLGYKDALKASGLKYSENSIFKIRYNKIYQDVALALSRLLKQKSKYDGIFFATDSLALNGIKALNAEHINITDTFKLTSFDENDTFDFLNFPVPHFAQPLDDIGKTAVQMILGQIENTERLKNEKIVFKAKWFEK